MKENILEIINDWDPIGFFPMAPKDEYTSEVEKIYEYVHSNHSLQIEQLAQRINELFVRRFGRDVYNEDMEQCIVVAKKILTGIT